MRIDSENFNLNIFFFNMLAAETTENFTDLQKKNCLTIRNKRIKPLNIST